MSTSAERRAAGQAHTRDSGTAQAGRVGEQPALDLQFAFPAVAGIPAGGQRAPRAFQPGAGQVEQRHLRWVRCRGQVPGGQPRLDRVLPAGQPVHRRDDDAGQARNFPSRSLIRNRARQRASSRSITRSLAACAAQDAVEWPAAPRILIRRLARAITANPCSRAPDRVTASKKSQASRAPAWDRRETAHVVGPRSGAGSIPAWCRISQTMEAATFTPDTSSSP